MRHVLPGLLFIALLVTPIILADPSCTLTSASNYSPAIIAALGVIVFFAAWIIGNLFDAIRNIYEWYGDDEWWNFLFTCDDDKKVEHFDRYYYNYYVLDANCVICLGLYLPFFYLPYLVYVLFIKSPSPILCGMLVILLVILVVALLIFFADAVCLKKDMRRLVTDYENKKT